ncbi:hypothetical protein ACJJTC_013707 [Scirpophaga incertulas]
MAVRVLLLLAVIGYTHCQLIKLSCQQVRQFVDGHNWRREQLLQGKVPGQPSASEMTYMVWDQELAAKAEMWASQYRYQHNNDRTIPSGRYETGENLYWYITSDFNYQLNPDSACESWFNEYKDYTYGKMKPSDFGGPKDIGHYTQMAWSDSKYLGCAMSQWSIDGYNKYFVVCNYGPPGNYMGQYPYPSGGPGSRLTCRTGDCSRPYGNNC